MNRHFYVNMGDFEEFINSIKQNKLVVASGAENIYEAPFETVPIDNYENSLSENFPNCCEFHSITQKEAKNWIDKFYKSPTYKQIIGQWPEAKVHYENLPERLFQKITFTEHHIVQSIDKEDWYKDITDYMEYTITSFGSPRIGKFFYLHSLKFLLNHQKEETVLYQAKEKREKLLEYIEKQEVRGKAQKNDKDKDINLLNATYQKWQKAFPDLEFFSNMKEAVKNEFPLSLILYDGTYNPYLRETKYKVRTQSELIELLGELTKKLLGQVDTPDLIRKGILKNKDKYDLELKLEHHRIKQSKLVGDFRKDERVYLNTIKQWLKNEKTLLKEIGSKLKAVPNILNPEKEEKTLPPLNKEITYLGLFRQNEDRLNKFFELLKKPEVSALDKNNNWVFNTRKNSIVACFQALEELDYIKKNLPKAQLQRIVATKIHFEGNEKLFRNSYNPDDYNEFYRLFKNQL